MPKVFAVKSVRFNNYERFAKRCNAIGWTYRKLGGYTMSAKSMVDNECLYFATTGRYMFSNTDEKTKMFNLDTEQGFNDAIEYAIKNK